MWEPSVLQTWFFFLVFQHIGWNVHTSFEKLRARFDESAQTASDGGIYLQTCWQCFGHAGLLVRHRNRGRNLLLAPRNFDVRCPAPNCSCFQMMRQRLHQIERFVFQPTILLSIHFRMAQWETNLRKPFRSFWKDYRARVFPKCTTICASTWRIFLKPLCKEG